LTARQRRAIPLVLPARNIEEGCRSARITTQTWYTWLREEGFKAEVDRQREEVISEALDRLKAAVNEAVEGLTALMGAEEKNIRLRACERVLDFLLKSKELEEIEERLSELEKAVGGKRGGI
jgi:beta-phosphoglucomutase-like phosphatase (HAD superfamily)